MRTRMHKLGWLATVVATIFVATGALADDKKDEPRPDQTATETKDEVTTNKAGLVASRPGGLSNAQVAAWLMLQHHREVEISKWAAE